MSEAAWEGRIGLTVREEEMCGCSRKQSPFGLRLLGPEPTTALGTVEAPVILASMVSGEATVSRAEARR